MTDELVPVQKRDLSMERGGVKIQGMNDLVMLASALVRGGIAKPNMSVDRAIGIMLAGSEIGLGWVQSLQSIDWINGKPTLYGDGVTALLMGSGMLEQREVIEQGKDDALTVIVRLKRKGFASWFEGKYSLGDAKRAGLIDRPTWKSYPHRMCYWRAFSFAARDGFADVLRGIWCREEAMDIPSEPAPPPPPAENTPEAWVQEAIPDTSPEPVAASRIAPAVPVVYPVVQEAPKQPAAAPRPRGRPRKVHKDITRPAWVDGPPPGEQEPVMLPTPPTAAGPPPEPPAMDPNMVVINGGLAEEPEEAPEPPPPPPPEPAKPKLQSAIDYSRIRLLLATATEVGKSLGELKQYVKDKYGRSRMDELTSDEIHETFLYLESLRPAEPETGDNNA